MKLFVAGEKGRALCDVDGAVPTTFAYRDVPFDDRRGVARGILVGVCDRCGRVVTVPPQATPAIKAARDKAVVAFEAVLPAMYVDALDLACFRVDPGVTSEFRKRLLMYYLHRSSRSKAAFRRLLDAARRRDEVFRIPRAVSAKRRLSMKISPAMSAAVDAMVKEAGLSRTDIVKGSLVQIRREIVDPASPENLDELRMLAAVANC